jgi:YVTN family beta-propeller protein
MNAQQPVKSVPDPGVIPTRQMIVPAGTQAIFDGRVSAVSFCGQDTEITVALSGPTILRLSTSSNTVLGKHSEPPQAIGIQGMSCGGATGNVLLTLNGYAAGSQKRLPSILLLTGSRLTAERRVGAEQSTGTPFVNESDAWQTASRLSGELANGALGGIGVSSNSSVGVAALTASDEVAVFDLAQMRVRQRIHVGIAPFTAIVDRTGSVAWVSNWGGRVPRRTDLTAPTGPDAGADRVVIDARGIASTGTLSRLDLLAGRVTNEVSVGLHPTALAWDEDRNRLYVTNGNSDSVSVIDTKLNRVLATWEVQPFSQKVQGVAPTALALAPDGRRLYVTCGGINAVAVIETANGSIDGLIPTGWYPSHVAISASGKQLAVATLLGAGSGSASGASLKGVQRGTGQELQPGLNRRYVHAVRSTVHLIAVPESSQLASYTRAVLENNHLLPRAALLEDPNNETPRSRMPPLPVPERRGEPSPIEHVIYIVKENRTYDQLFGDLEKGNSDPSLTLYGEEVTPNHHKLAREYVLLDNFFATGGNSGDGHQWVTQANETDYAYWRGYGGRSYPFDGNDPIAYSSGGFLWDAALKAGKTFADFGEFIPERQAVGQRIDPNLWQKLRADLLQQWKFGDQFIDRFRVSSPIPPLDTHLVRDFPSYGGESPDVVRARIFLRHLHQWEQTGSMPNLIYLQLPSDHTGGTTPGYSTPKACLADNDLALGQIIEGLTHSKFWPKLAIFVVEDDAQGGVDHVDGHRTVALVISPYIRRQSVDSTFYSHPSITKTIELMLGLPPLSLFDLIANDMRNSFTTTPDFTPYTAVEPKQSLFEVNPPAQALTGQVQKDALTSARMDWSAPDAVPSEQLNRILWRKERGRLPYPKSRQALFLPYSVNTEEEEESMRRVKRRK